MGFQICVLKCHTLICTESNLSEQDLEGMVEWLKSNTEPEAKIKDYMEKTVKKRAEWIRENPGLDLSMVKCQYPRLFDIPCIVSTGTMCFISYAP